MIQGQVNSALNQLSSFATQVKVVKRESRVYNPTTDSYGEGKKYFEASVIITKDNRKGLTKIPADFTWKNGDEIVAGDDYYHVDNVVIKADAAVVLELSKSND